MRFDFTHGKEATHVVHISSGMTDDMCYYSNGKEAREGYEKVISSPRKKGDYVSLYNYITDKREAARRF